VVLEVTGSSPEALGHAAENAAAYKAGERSQQRAARASAAAALAARNYRVDDAITFEKHRE
jgi:flavin-binding protein dodecin